MNVLSIGDYPKNMESPSSLNPIIKKCTDMSPDNRYQNVTELKQALENMLLGQGKDKEVSKEDKLDTNIQKNKTLNTSKKEATRLLGFYKLIPGFRTTTTWKMVIAILWYMFIVSGMIIEPIAAMMILLLSLLYTNFLDVRNKLPLLKSKSISLRILGYFLYTFIIFMALGAFL